MVTDATARPARNYRVEALAKGLRILSLFSSTRPTLRVKDIADAVGYPMPTVFRLVTTLEEAGFLERAPDGAMRPGVGVLALGFAALQGQDLVQTSAPTLRQLAEESGATVNLGVLRADQVLIVARVQSSPTALAANIRVGSTVPAVFSSMGKVMLAYLPKDEFDRRVSRASFEGEWGPRAVRSLPALRKQLVSVRDDGFIVQEEEAIPGLSSIAGPVHEAGGTVAASLNVAVPAARYDRDRLLQELRDPVLHACRTISARLGA